MGLSQKFDDRLKTALGMRAVWEPGSTIDLGDVLQRQDGIYRPIANLGDFGVTYRKEAVSKEKSLAFQARGVSTTVLQAGGEVRPHGIDAKAETELKIEFNAADTYMIRTPMLTGRGIDNLFMVGKQLKNHADWEHGKFYIAWRVYSAKEFLFLGSQAKNKAVRFGGTGGAILNFLTFGISGEVSRLTSSEVAIEIVGAGGPVAMAVASVRKGTGQIEFD